MKSGRIPDLGFCLLSYTSLKKLHWSHHWPCCSCWANLDQLDQNHQNSTDLDVLGLGSLILWCWSKSVMVLPKSLGQNWVYSGGTGGVQVPCLGTGTASLSCVSCDSPGREGDSIRGCHITPQPGMKGELIPSHHHLSVPAELFTPSSLSISPSGGSGKWAFKNN